MNLELWLRHLVDIIAHINRTKLALKRTKMTAPERFKWVGSQPQGHFGQKKRFLTFTDERLDLQFTM